MRQLWIFGVGCLLLAACGGGGSSSGAPTTASTSSSTTTTSTTTTTEPESTTTTTEPGIRVRGVIFDDGKEPTFAADGVTARIHAMIVVTPRSDAPGASDCADSLELADDNERSATECLYVQWNFDVASDFRTGKYAEEGGLSADSLLTPDGIQHRSVFGTSALPGSRDNSLDAAFPLTAMGGSLHFKTGSNLVGWTNHTYPVPATLPYITLGTD